MRPLFVPIFVPGREPVAYGPIWFDACPRRCHLEGRALVQRSDDSGSAVTVHLPVYKVGSVVFILLTIPIKDDLVLGGGKVTGLDMVLTSENVHRNLSTSSLLLTVRLAKLLVGPTLFLKHSHAFFIIVSDALSLLFIL